MDVPRVHAAADPLLRIAEAAAECLKNNPYAVLGVVTCEFDQGVLFLRGRLSSFYQKQLAQEAVGKIAGVTRVVNEIEVTRPNWKHTDTMAGRAMRQESQFGVGAMKSDATDGRIKPC